MQDNLYIVIVGCGRLGSDLANRLSREGHLVVVIDHDESAFGNLSHEFSGFRVEGDATQLAVLNKAKLKKSDLVFAVTHEDNMNLMVAQVAHKIFNVPRVLARVFDPRRTQAYKHLGIETVCPTTVAAELFLKTVANYEASKKGNKS
ncbi:MAG: TrkA family potassium uptake protein [Desulfobacterales bacterium]|nr:TrkA family potassium uptake protein [Desulfobacterales bacterium]